MLDSEAIVQQNHWSERGRATSVANADALGRPRRSVLAFGHMVSHSQIDDAILAVLADRDGHWTKVAWVVVSAPDRLGGDFPSDSAGHQLVAGRIEALVEEGRLISKGDITQWRFSEVRPA